MKKIFNTIRKMKQVLFAVILVFGFLTSYSQELGYYDFPYTGSGYTITFTGGVGAYGGSYAGMCGVGSGCKGNAFSMNGYSGGVSVTFNFSSAVNNVVIRQGAINAGNVTTVTTNGGALSFSASGPTCGYAQYNNGSGTVSWPTTGTGYNDENFKVTAASSFTTMTVNISGDHSLLTLDMGSVAATPPSTPTAVSASQATICSGSGTNLTATAGSGNTVYWYSGSCGGTYVGTGNITVYPTTTTTYYAKNYNGQYSASCGSTTVTVNYPASAPTSASGTPTGTSTANLAFNGATGGTPTYYWVVGTSPSVTYGSGVAQGSTTETSSTTSALSASTTYYLRVYSSNGTCGNSATYTSSSFRTSSVISYTAGANGSLTGTTSQTIANGGAGTAVTAVPNANYHFVNWSDGSTVNPRTDSNVTNSANLTANFAANKLVFGTQPLNSIAGAVIPLTVRIIKTDGTTITDATNLVTISIQNNPNSGTLAGTLTRAAVAGVATFDDAWINRTGIGYTIKAIGDAPSIIVTQPISNSFNITPAALKYFTVEGITTPVVAGTTTSPIVKVYDLYDNLKTNYTGTVLFTSDDAKADLPAAYTFNSIDKGVHTFTNGVTLKTTLNRSVTVKDNIETAKTGTQSPIHVDPDVITHFDLLVNNNLPVMAGVPFSALVTVRDRFDNLKTDFTGENLLWTTNAISSPNGTPRHLVENGPQTFIEGQKTVNGFIFYNSAQTPYLTVSDGATSSEGTHNNIVVVNNEINNFLVESGTGTSASFSQGTSMVAGTSFSVKVTARDIYWNTHITYDGTVRFKTSNDALNAQSVGVHVPANYTYNASDQGIHVFANSTTIHETGAYWMRVGEGAALAKSGIQEGIIVGPGAFDPGKSTLVLVPSGPTTRTAGEYVQVEFTPKDAYNNLLCVATGTKTIKLNDSGTENTYDYNGGIAENILKVASLATGSFSSNVRVTKAGTNTITAWYDGIEFLTDVDIEVSPAETSYYTINDVTSIIAGETRAAYTVSRYDQFGNLQKSGNETITLSSNATDTNEKFYTAADGVTPVTTVTLANGSGSANFWYYDEKAGDWSISATGLSGISAITDAITVIPGATNHFHLTSPADITAGGSRAAYTVTRHDQFSNEVFAGNQPVYLHSASTGANKKFYTVATGGTPTSSISIAGNSSTANFWYYDEKTSFFGTDGSGFDAEWTITASDVATAPNGTDSGIIDGTDGIKVLPTTIANAPNSFEITSESTSYYGDPQTITVKAMDTYGNVKTNYSGFIKFSNTDTQAINPAENQTLVNGSKTFTDGVIFSAISSGPDRWWLTVLNPNGTLFGGKTFVVLPRPITITAISNQTKTYGETKVLDNTITAFSVASSLTPVLKAGESITNVTLGSPGTLASANVGDYAITPSAATGAGGFVASNYTIAYSTAGKLTVNPKPLVISITADNKTYDGTATATTHATITSGLIEGHVVTVGSSNGAFNDKNAGTNKSINADVSITGGTDAGNYTSNSAATTKADITKFDVTGSFVASSKVYDATDAATVTSRSVAVVFEGDDLSLTGGTAKFSDKNVANDKTVTLTGEALSGTDAGNYNLAVMNTTKADITPASLTVTATGPAKAYGTALTTGVSSTNFTAVGMVNSETVTSVTLTPDAAGLSASTLAGAAYVVTPSLSTGTGGFIADNYNITYTAFNGTVGKKVLTVTADAKSKTYDGSGFSSFTSTITGFVNGETISDAGITGSVLYSGAATTASDAGSYAITPLVSGLSAANYSFASVNGSLYINTETIYVTAVNKEKSLGDIDPTLTYTYSPNLIGGDLFIGTLTRTTGENLGTYRILKGSLSLNYNYDISFQEGTFSITDHTVPLWVTESGNLNRTVEYHDAAGLAAAQALAPVASDNDVTQLTKVSGQFVQQEWERNGTYTNTWTAKDSSGNTSIVYTQVITIIDSPTAISGTVSSTTGSVTDGIQIVLLKIGDNNQTTIVKKIDLNGSSSFTFGGLPSGTYLLNAVVTDVVKHPDLSNTYYNGSSSVFNAQRIEIGSQNNAGIQLLMLQKTVAASNGSISGLVTRKVGPATFGDTQAGELAPDVDVVLKQDGKIVANTLTNMEGKYSFNLLPEGNYVVEVEQLGFILDIIKNVTIAANSQNAVDVNFTIWTTGTITKVNDLITTLDINMYPNPTSGQLNITSSKDGYATVSVFNASGKEVFRQNYLSGEAINIDLSRHVSGFYFVKLECEGESVTRKIILRK